MPKTVSFSEPVVQTIDVADDTVLMRELELCAKTVSRFAAMIEWLQNKDNNNDETRENIRLMMDLAKPYHDQAMQLLRERRKIESDGQRPRVLAKVESK